MKSLGNRRPSILVVGDVMIDRYLIGKVDRISPEAPVPVLVRERDHAVAGGAANVAVNISALECDVQLVSVVGIDRDAEDLKELLRISGISTEYIYGDTGRPTISKTRVVSGRQQFFRIDREEPGHLSEKMQTLIVNAVNECIEEATIIVLSDYAKGVLTDEVLSLIIRSAKSSGKMVLVDPKRRTFESYAGADLIKPNSGELSSASGLPCRTDEEVELAAIAIRRQFSGTLLVTRAEAGLSLISPNRSPRHIKTSAVEVADVSGAGDTALAALAVSIAEGRSIEEAAMVSNFAAGIAVGKLGTAVVSRGELNSAIARASITHHPGSLVTADEARGIASTWRRMGEQIVFTNGCYDLIHAGHIELLSAAAQEGSRLIIGLNSDSSVRRLKGTDRPIQTEQDRARIIGALRAVDLVVLFDEETPISLIDSISPDVLVKGADYTEDKVVGGELVKSRGGRVVLIPLVAGRSSSRIVEKLRS